MQHTLQISDKPQGAPCIMIINWRWEYGIAEIKDMSEEWQQQIAQLAEPAVKIFEAKSEFTGTACIVAVCIMKGYQSPTNDLFQQLTDALLTKPAYEGARIFLFLHEGHQQTPEDMQQLRKNKDIENCFCFSSGRSIIYHSVHKKGFLNDNGKFQNNSAPNTCELSPERAILYLKEPYFDDVWYYYEHEFKQKLFELKHDLMDLLTPHTLPSQPEEADYVSFAEKFKNDEKKQGKKILLRLKSFLGVYDLHTKQKEINEENMEAYAKAKAEVATLEKFEKDTHRYYSFGDFDANITHQLRDNADAAQKVYKNLKETLHSMLDELLGIEGSSPPPTISKQNIREIRSSLRELIVLIPGDET